MGRFPWKFPLEERRTQLAREQVISYTPLYTVLKCKIILSQQCLSYSYSFQGIRNLKIACYKKNKTKRYFLISLTPKIRLPASSQVTHNLTIYVKRKTKQ
jgi:hypothetical protein